MTVTPGTVAYVTTGGKSSYMSVKFLRLVTLKKKMVFICLPYILSIVCLTGTFQTLMQLGKTASILS